MREVKWLNHKTKSPENKGEKFEANSYRIPESLVKYFVSWGNIVV